MSTITMDSVFSKRQNRARPETFWIALVVGLAAMLFMSWNNIPDPLVRYDDFPALLAEPEGFWIKTLTEGRWVNYWWHLRSGLTDASVNFVLHQTLWALFSAAFATLAFPRRQELAQTLVLTLVLLVAPPALVIMPWFNTLIPGTAILATYTVIALFAPIKATRLLFLPFVVLGFMSYTTFPLVMMAVCLLASPKRSFVRTILMVIYLAISLAVAMAVVNGLNWIYHGVFDVRMVDARISSPASDIQGLIDNLPVLRFSLDEVILRFSLNQPLLAIALGALFVLSTLVVARRDWKLLLYVQTPLWVGMGLISLQILKTGVQVPPRAFHFVWIALVLQITGAFRPGYRQGISVAFPAALALIGLFYYYLATNYYGHFREWQTETRELSTEAAKTDGPLYLIGDLRDYPPARSVGIQKSSYMAGRMQQLIGRDVIICEMSPDACEHLPNGVQNQALDKQTKLIVEQRQSYAVILVPPATASD